jgi:hypothetical protein
MFHLSIWPPGAAIFAPFRHRLLVVLLAVALLRLRALLVASDEIIANLSPWFMLVLHLYIKTICP